MSKTWRSCLGLGGWELRRAIPLAYVDVNGSPSYSIFVAYPSLMLQGLQAVTILNIYLYPSSYNFGRPAYLIFLLANIHNLSLVTNLNTFNKSAALLFDFSRSQSIDQRSNPLITSTIYQCVSRRGSLEGGISEMRCVITGDDKEQRAEMVRFSVLL